MNPFSVESDHPHDFLLLYDRKVSTVAVLGESDWERLRQLVRDEIEGALSRVPEPLKEARNAQKDTSGQGGWSG